MRGGWVTSSVVLASLVVLSGAVSGWDFNSSLEVKRDSFQDYFLLYSGDGNGSNALFGQFVSNGVCQQLIEIGHSSDKKEKFYLYAQPNFNQPDLFNAVIVLDQKHVHIVEQNGTVTTLPYSSAKDLIFESFFYKNFFVLNETTVIVEEKNGTNSLDGTSLLEGVISSDGTNSSNGTSSSYVMKRLDDVCVSGQVGPQKTCVIDVSTENDTLVWQYRAKESGNYPVTFNGWTFRSFVNGTDYALCNTETEDFFSDPNATLIECPQRDGNLQVLSFTPLFNAQDPFFVNYSAPFHYVSTTPGPTSTSVETTTDGNSTEPPVPPHTGGTTETTGNYTEVTANYTVVPTTVPSNKTDVPSNVTVVPPGPTDPTGEPTSTTNDPSGPTEKPSDTTTGKPHPTQPPVPPKTHTPAPPATSTGTTSTEYTSGPVAAAMGHFPALTAIAGVVMLLVCGVL
ncbi:unnamed protein product [Bursaphelenchus okinawaensis]|uniref:Uncharacterized protein n=1 Tax=Bursaphelenchus okinawaensis TaxID=465554 RepID=A0A811JPX5_9BILA|nr:unnamed protein product [Bursaphelenchus okinawaensis]CAG9077235.1 unnamed protein product [Bursaphelenchus okinawaensis]